MAISSGPARAVRVNTVVSHCSFSSYKYCISTVLVSIEHIVGQKKIFVICHVMGASCVFPYDESCGCPLMVAR